MIFWLLLVAGAYALNATELNIISPTNGVSVCAGEALRVAWTTATNYTLLDGRFELRNTPLLDGINVRAQTETHVIIPSTMNGDAELVMIVPVIKTEARSEPLEARVSINVRQCDVKPPTPTITNAITQTVVVEPTKMPDADPLPPPPFIRRNSDNRLEVSWLPSLVIFLFLTTEILL